MNIRQASEDDYIHIMNMYEHGIRELGERFEESHALATIIHAMKQAPCFLLCDDDIICGMVGLRLLKNSHNGDARLTEYIFYVFPRYRSLENLTKLVEESKNFALSINTPLYFTLVMDASLTVKKRLLEMHGFKVTGISGEWVQKVVT